MHAHHMRGHKGGAKLQGSAGKAPLCLALSRGKVKKGEGKDGKEGKRREKRWDDF